MTIKLGVHGAAGRMGRAVLAVAGQQELFTIAAAIDVKGSPHIGLDAGLLFGSTRVDVAIADTLSALEGVEVVIDFSTPRATAQLVGFCADLRIPCVIGTTGAWDDAAKRSLREARSKIPFVFASNFSPGVTVLFHLAEQAAKLLGSDFDAEIVEMHHRHKLDAPSGTAFQLANVVGKAKGLSADAKVFGRSPGGGARKNGEIGLLSLRGGDVVGDHTLILAGPSERIELTHRAHHREVFARGAVRAAEWVVAQPPGWYDMKHVMGLEPI